jgi:predicted N-formylglutamate amidohydrolase
MAAPQFVSAYAALGVVADLNVPWSAKEGFMHAADQFSLEATAVIMLEVRQDLAADVEWRTKVVAATEAVLKAEGHY